MFWFCEFKKDFDANPVTSKIEEIAESVATSFEPVRLFKCPKGYVYDDNVKFCQPSEEVRCLYPRKQEEKEELISPWGTLNDFSIAIAGIPLEPIFTNMMMTSGNKL